MLTSKTTRSACFVRGNSVALIARESRFLLNLLIVTIACLTSSHALGDTSQSTDPQPPNTTGQVQEMTIRVGDLERSYLAYFPANLPQGAALVIALHGYRMTGSKMRRATGWIFETLADRHEFALIYPNGYKESWNDCRKLASFPASLEDVDDVAFIRALIGSLVSEIKIDPKKVYIFGYSNGGQMAFRMAVTASKEIAAIATAGANWPTRESSQCAHEGQISRVMMVNGDLDPSSPYEGGDVGSLGAVMSARASADAFAKRNSVLEPPAEKVISIASKEDSTAVHQLAWSREGQPIVTLYTVRGGGHVVPQPVFRYPAHWGATSQFDAPSASWAFFSSK